jgi:hypothetical protein
MALELSVVGSEQDEKSEKKSAGGAINWRKLIKLEYEKLNKKFDSKKTSDIR